MALTKVLDKVIEMMLMLKLGMKRVLVSWMEMSFLSMRLRALTVLMP